MYVAFVAEKAFLMAHVTVMGTFLMSVMYVAEMEFLKIIVIVKAIS
jgi:hypothetical protein